MQQKLILAVLLTAVLILFGRTLNPLDSRMFEFHDETQAARIQEFTYNLQTFHLPPRMAPHFSYNLGYPVFDLYAPFSYWITSLIHLVPGVTIIAALKLSFLFSGILAFIGAYIFLKQLFSKEAALLGASVYSSFLYIALDIFVRGNLGEMWFITLLPWSLYSLYANSKNKTKRNFIVSIFILSAALTVHNLFSLLFLPIAIGFVLLLPNKKINFIALLFSLLLSSYFILPFITESSLTYAQQVATATNYHDHFLCPFQLWQSNWGYGGSAPGCIDDGLGFKLGKIQIILSSLGFMLFLFFSIQKKIKKQMIILGSFMMSLTIGSLFLTTYQSQFIWDTLHTLMAIIQFPWRFIGFSLIGMAFFCAFLGDKTPSFPYKKYVLLLLCFFCLFASSKYFQKPLMNQSAYEQKYQSTAYIEKIVAYRIAEYLPRSANYDYWRKIANTSFDTHNQPVDSIRYDVIKNDPYDKIVKWQADEPALINIHFFPYWHLYLNSNAIQPSTFDLLGRPMMQMKKNDILRVIYKESSIEQVSTILSLITLMLIALVIFNKKLWKLLIK